MHLLDLNRDVFSVFLSFTSRVDALHLAYTSHEAFSLAIPRVMEEVTLRTPESTKQFASLASNDPRRIAWVRRLHITLWATYNLGSKARELSSDIASFLCKAHNLTELRLARAEDLLSCHAHLENHISSLMSLRTVEFIRVGQRAALVLSSMKSRICHLYLEDSLSTLPPLDPLSSVHVLEVANVDLSRMLRDTQWTDVLKATWRRSSVSIYSLAYAFPNITSLSLLSNTYHFRAHPGIQCRPGENPWRNLHHLEGFLDDLSTNKNFLFPIRRLTISEHTHIGQWETRDALDIVKTCSPVVLSLAFHPQSEFLAALIQVLPRIKCMRTVIPDTTTIEEIMGWIPTLGQHIGQLPLVAYCLCIRRPYAVTVGDALTDFPAILAESVPSTRFVALDMGEEGSRPIWWHVIRDPEGLVQTIQISGDINGTVNDMLLACDEKTDVSQVEAYLKTPMRDR